jgi:hypothetical protein
VRGRGISGGGDIAAHPARGRPQCDPYAVVNLPACRVAPVPIEVFTGCHVALGVLSMVVVPVIFVSWLASPAHL